MRMLALIPLLVLVACSDASGGETKAAEAEEATALTPGQWEITREITRFASTDNGEPALVMAVGTTTTFSHCVAEADAEKPAPNLFAGLEGGECEYRNFYMSSGRINVSLACDPPEQDGQIMRTVDGHFTAETLEATATAETYFGPYGNVSMASELTGRRVGDCPAA